MPSNHLILCCPLLLLPSIFPSIRVFSNESALCIRWPKYWSFSFSISSFNEYSGLISFRMDWLDLFAVQGILKSLFQHHSSKASILWCSAFFIVQLSHPHMTTGKTVALTRWTAGSRRETFHSWQRSWGRRLGIHKGRIEPQESPPDILEHPTPQKPESAYFIALCSHLWLYRGLSPTTILLSLSKS